MYSDTWVEHLEHLKAVFNALRYANLAAKPAKCYFGFQELTFLGHIVGNGKIKPTLDKIEAIQGFPRPDTKKKVRSFIGLIGFYRKFIHDFSVLATPLQTQAYIGINPDV